MVLTVKETLPKYEALHPRFAAAFAAMAELAERPHAPGRYPVDGDDIYINALEAPTRPEDGALMEAHGRYADIMWILSGEEQIGVCDTAALTDITQPYDPERDLLLAKIPAACTWLQMKPGSICILFPEDAHAPGLHVHGPCNMRKLIGKVRVD